MVQCAVRLTGYTILMTQVLVLFGGTSNEREVSLRSGAAVIKALQAKGYEVIPYDPKNGTDKFPKADVAFPVLHGVGGEDGTIQASLERAGIPYVGSGPAASSLCFDKWVYKQQLQKAGLPTAEAVLVTGATIWQSARSQKPFVLKPISGGSSIDAFIVRDLAQLNKVRVMEALEHYREMLLEELVEGLEITVGVLEDQALPAVEIIPPKSGEFDYDNKYNGLTQEICPPTHISEKVQQEAQELALMCHKLTGCRDLSRTDLIVSNGNRLIILETNTLPGMTDASLYPKAATAAGVPMAELADRLVKAVLTRA